MKNNIKQVTRKDKPYHLTAVPEGKTEYKHAIEQIKSPAKFPEENPFPVLRLSGDGTIMYSNAPGRVLLEQWNKKIGGKTPKEWRRIIKKSLESGNYQVKDDVVCGERVFSFAVAPVTEDGYVNLYGRDVTVHENIKNELRKSRDELEIKVKQRTAELTQTVAILQHEVQDRISAERALKESEEKHRSLVEFLPEGICVLVDGKIAFANTAAANLLKSEDVGSLISKNMWEFIHPDSKTIVKNNFTKVLKEKTSIPAKEIKIIALDGSITDVEGSITIINHNGKKGILAIFHDITERKKAHEMVKAERQQMNDVLETLPAYVCLLTPDYHMPFANRIFRELFGEPEGRKCYEFLFDRTEPCENCETYTTLKTNAPHRWEWTGPNHRDYSVFDFPFTDTDGSSMIMEMGIDITEQKRAEKRSRITNELLEKFATKTSRKEYLDSVVEIIREWSGCRCVGIRLTNADGYIPYESCVGFSDEFLSLESNLCLRKDVCACIRVVAHTPEPQDTAVMTKRGSFRCDNTFSFVDSLSENEKKRYRGNCLKAGFASIAVVPVRYREKIIGAIHIADERENKVPLEIVEFLEDMAALVGEALHRFNVEESLLLNEQRLLDAQRITHLGNWEWDIIKNRLWWSDEVYRIFGLEPGRFGATYDAFLSYVHPDDRKLVEKSVNKALYKGKDYNIDHRVIKPNGSERIVNEKAEVTYDSENRPVKMLGTVHDITERKQAENEIRENQRKLIALTAELQLAEEKERRRIAQDLHDSIGQILSFSGRELKQLQKSLPEKTAKSVQEIANQLDIAVEQARTLSFDLSPSTLYDLGFEVAIEELVDRMSKERKIRCQLENCQSPKPLAVDIKVLLYRAVRELLINAVKHANAGLVKVSLSRSGSDIYIKVEDDGDGFDTKILNISSKKARGFGIFSIHERLNHIGGQLKIESARGKGTKVVLTAPLDLENEN